GRYPKQDKSKFFKHYKTYFYNTEDCYSYQVQEVDETMSSIFRKINTNNLNDLEITTTKASTEANNKYQGYQEYLKAKQAYFVNIQDHYTTRKKEASNLKTITETLKK
ncbi:30736_t:CDS:2, partial [Gigaspora margarita]